MEVPPKDSELLVRFPNEESRVTGPEDGRPTSMHKRQFVRQRIVAVLFSRVNSKCLTNKRFFATLAVTGGKIIYIFDPFFS